MSAVKEAVTLDISDDELKLLKVVLEDAGIRKVFSKLMVEAAQLNLEESRHMLRRGDIIRANRSEAIALFCEELLGNLTQRVETQTRRRRRANT